MKAFLSFLLGILFIVSGFAQTSTNFICSDCEGNPHNLFAELDAGKVIVLCWVMPCGTCISPALTTYNVVASYQTSYPDRVYFYCIDDYADTNCSSVKSWSNSNNMPSASFKKTFSNASIDMTDYGTSGMPKIVVLGGSSHTVYYNVNNTVNAADLQNAINSALTPSTSIKNTSNAFSLSGIFPNPATNITTVTFSLHKSSKIKLEVFNSIGHKVSETEAGLFSQGKNFIPVNTSNFSNGIYLLKITAGDRNKVIKLNVFH